MLCASDGSVRYVLYTQTAQPAVQGSPSHLCVGDVGKEKVAESCTASPGWVPGSDLQAVSVP